MKLTENTNRIRIESPKFHRNEVWIKSDDNQWFEASSPHLTMTQLSFQARLYHDDKQGFEIYDISFDEAHIQYNEQAMKELGKTDRMIAFHIKHGMSLEAVFNGEVYDTPPNFQFIEHYKAAYNRVMKGAINHHELGSR